MNEINFQAVKDTDHGQFKWVRVNGQYRFTDLYSDHISLVRDGEKAESAGFIVTDHDNDNKLIVRWCKRESMTCKVGPLPGDKEAICDLLGARCVGEFS